MLVIGSSLLTHKLTTNDSGADSSSTFKITDVLGSTTERPSFQTYSFENNSPPASLEIDDSSITYDKGILLYRLNTPSGQSVTVSQQQLPEGLTSSVLQGDESFDTPVGKATFSNTSDGRLTGSLVTKDGVFILVNTSDPIEETTIKDILRFLRPV